MPTGKTGFVPFDPRAVKRGGEGLRSGRVEQWCGVGIRAEKRICLPRRPFDDDQAHGLRITYERRTMCMSAMVDAGTMLVSGSALLITRLRPILMAVLAIAHISVLRGGD